MVVREVPFDEFLIRGIHAIYNECPSRQGRRFSHYGASIEKIREMKATFLDQSIFIGAFCGDVLIGFAKLVVAPDRCQAGLMHILAMMQHRDKAPTNALIAQAVRSCAELGVPYLWYAKYTYGKKRADSLAEFKKHNGFQKVDIHRYYVPLTKVGRLALQLGLQHEGIDCVPAPIAAAFRGARKAWHRLQLFSLLKNSHKESSSGI